MIPFQHHSFSGVVVMHKILIVAACIGMLMACSKRPHGAATLALSPAAVKNCGAGTPPVAIDIRWDATRANSFGVKIWINNQQEPASSGIFGGDVPGTLWLAGKTSGAATTGSWIVPGTRIIMTDSDSGDMLAQTKVAGVPCH
ncbi:MAG: hypothetical protein ABI870_04295 [Rhodanobacter sp.]